MNPENTAVVFVEYQNDFLSPEGKLYGAVQKTVEDTKMLSNSTNLLKALREHKVPVIQATLQFSEDYKEMGPHPYGILEVVRGANAFQKDSWGADLIEEMKPQEGEVWLKDKRSLSVFPTTDLNTVLQEKKINNVAFAGLLTNVCLESSMRDAYDRGYNVVALEDCMATVGDGSEHRHAIEKSFPLFAEVLTSKAFMDILKQSVASTP